MGGVKECSTVRWKGILKISRKQRIRNDKEGKKERKGRKKKKYEISIF